jgi:hypothetical protein
MKKNTTLFLNEKTISKEAFLSENGCKKVIFRASREV